MQSAQNISASHFTRGSDTKLKLYQSIQDSNITLYFTIYFDQLTQSNLNDKTIVYIPTEGNLPILEATRPVLEAPKAE